MIAFYNKYIRPLYLTKLFYQVLVGIILLFVISYLLPFLFAPAKIILIVFFLIVLLDYRLLFSVDDALSVSRNTGARFSNGDNNPVFLNVKNTYPFKITANIIDEVPHQFQLRKFSLLVSLNPDEDQQLKYILRPTERGEYEFKDVNSFIRSPVGLIVKRQITKAEQIIRVYPSFFPLQQFELKAYSNNLSESGSRKIRKIGHSLEFEQIKEYVTGDDIRSINWKATARRGNLMVNRFTDEKSQQIYCLIDKGRVMKMPFNGMSLLDYSINAALILTRVALIRQDKAGLITFAEDVNSFLPADRKPAQIGAVMETLYNQKTAFLETDYEKVYALLKTRVTQRSLIVLFSNFESLSGMQRQLPYLRAIARNHLVLVIFFENTELHEITNQPAENIEALYIKTIAEKFTYEKKLIVKELRQHGIFTILTTPEDLTLNTVNKYLELKARQAI